MLLEQERKEHDQYQRSYFDKRVDFFAQAIPEAIEDRTRQIVLLTKLDKDSRVLDVGTGCGVLINHFIACGVQEENVLGVDLSAKMLEQARSRFPKAHFWQGDILDFQANPSSNEKKAGANKFDAIFFNACFGNIFNQEKAIEQSSQLLNPLGKIIISHPMGAKFVRALHNQEPELVPHLLPDRKTLDSWCSKFHLKLANFIDEPQLYTAMLVSASQ